jgi:hypothetical protein
VGTGENVSIDKSGKWWKGNEPRDIREYLEAFGANEAYAVDAYRSAVCSCGGEGFYLWADDGEGVAKRVCPACEREHFVCDSEEYWSVAKPEQWRCVECASMLANIGVGFSLYEDGEVRWLYVGERCSTCGVLGCMTQWKVAYAPSKQLLDQV